MAQTLYTAIAAIDDARRNGVGPEIPHEVELRKELAELEAEELAEKDRTP